MDQLELNSIWPGWTLTGKLGQGSYGGVYEIHRILPGGRVEKSALKKISIPRNPEELDSLLTQSGSEERISTFFREQLRTLTREYSMMRDLESCPNIVACQDLHYQPNGYGWDIYFRMELLTPLKQVIDNHYREMNVIRLGIEVCAALEACATRNIIHRDIKPENILVSENGVFKLGDFGIAKTAEKTQTGTMAGTFGYMAPEVANRKHYGSSADIYSLGMVLYWLMNNMTLPFLPLPPEIPTASQRQQALNRRFTGEPFPPPKNGSGDLKRIVLKACAFQPEDRYPNVRELHEALLSLYHWKQDQQQSIMQELDLPDSFFEEPDDPMGRKREEKTGELPKPAKREKRSRRTGLGVLLILAVVLSACAGWFLLRKNETRSMRTPAVSVPVETETVQITPQETEPVPTTLPAMTQQQETESAAAMTTEPAQTEPAANVACVYEQNGSGITITGFSGEVPAEAVLPDTLDGLPVTQIGSQAFLSNSAVKKIWIPKSVTEIGEKAFSGCTKLQNIFLPEGLVRIGAGAFENCTSLSRVDLPEKLQSIESWAFANCKRLTSLFLPSSVKALGEWAFSGCSGLQKLTINPGMTVIENYAFCDCTRLTEVAVPDGIKTIGIGAFSDCAQLSDVILPDSLRTLSANAFHNTALTSVTVNKNCSLGAGAVPLGCQIYQRG